MLAEPVAFEPDIHTDGGSVKKEVDGNGNEAKVVSVDTTRTTDVLLNIKKEMPVALVCCECPFVATNDAELDSHMQRHKDEVATPSTATQHHTVLCPLCQEACAERSALEAHLVRVHSVAEKGIQRLMALVECPVKTETQPEPRLPCVKTEVDAITETEALKLAEQATREGVLVGEKEEFRCQVCPLTFSSIDALYQHQDESGHLEAKETPGYLCWKKGCNQYFRNATTLQVHFREIHAKAGSVGTGVPQAYHHRCAECGLAFKTAERLRQHVFVHTVKQRCEVCGKGFATGDTLQQHMASTHKQENTANTPPPATPPPSVKLEVDNGYAAEGGSAEGGSAEQGSTDESTAYKEHQFFEDYINSQAIAENSYSDPVRKYKCHRCKVAFTKQGYLSAHNKTLMHRRGDKNHYPTEKYLDPNRPYKCDVCRESFTQKNILLVHYNSVSHLHRLKLQQAQGGEIEPVPEMVESDEKKPFRCQLCHVAYSQSSTLDIHMRSVLHQTRVSKVEPVAEEAGLAAVTPTENPAPMATPMVAVTPPTVPTQNNNKRLLQEMLQQRKAAASTAVTPVSTVMSSPMHSPLISQVLLQQSLLAAAASAHLQQQLLLTCARCGTQCVSPEALHQHQAHCGVARARSKPRVQRTLLENIGFECVMQFNEYNQRESLTSPTPRPSSGNPDKIPEMLPSACATCGKRFSSIWVLKAHEEEVHSNQLDLDSIKEYGETFRRQYEEKQEAAEAMSPADAPADLPVSLPQLDSISQNAVATAALLKMPMFGGMMHPMGHPMAMSIAPPLVPSPQMLMGFPPMPEMFGLSPSMFDPNAFLMQQTGGAGGLGSFLAQQTSVAAAAHAAAQQKRARTRITDDQLRILRAHFDLNSSPNEVQIAAMSERAGLPSKVIKHWFRNTLFKERQRNKDSPYNFNVPPATTLNLEEYERTGRVDDLPTPTPPHTPAAISTPLAAADRTPVLISTKDDCADNYESDVQPLPEVTTPTSISPSDTPQTSSAFNTSQSLTPSGEYRSLPSTGYLLGKRANRTRFNDYQIKILQEYFDQNPYPKDDDLEHLSRLLNLGPRIIVVWFQNARQKARKTYENQPTDGTSSNEGQGDGTRYSRTPGLNYQCKRCLTVFQRYYELIKHQKMYCFREESNPASDQSSPPPAPGEYACEKCGESFTVFEQWREHQLTHVRALTSDTVTSESSTVTSRPEFSFKPESAFAMLQSVAQQPSTSGQKRKAVNADLGGELPEDEDDLDMSGLDGMLDGQGDGQPKDKRLRTTILPEQLDLLYVHYAQDSNPSRKQLEAISRTVRLRKRVVQVWFQNTRARERKGQARAPQLIRKRCPMCNALFRARSALESHLVAKHPEAAGTVNVDELPDAEPEAGTDGGDAGELDANMKRLYEDSLRRYLDELSASQTASVNATVDETPLDLSRPVQAVPAGRHHDDSFSETHSESTDTHSGPSSPSGSITSHGNRLVMPPCGGSASKRYRTQMSEQQIAIMKRIFCMYKTPTMAECEMLGQEISLAKRVVQVWFQNARAKEKKLGAVIAKPTDTITCRLCNFQYTHKYTIQDHIFTRKHMQRLARAVQNEMESSEAETARVSGEESHLSQLHTMGLQAMRSPGENTSIGNKPRSTATEQNTVGSLPAKVKEETKSSASSEVSAGLANPTVTSALQAAPAFLNPFGAGTAPVMNQTDMATAAGMFSLMYPGIGMMYPGMGVPMMPPPASMMPGADGMMMYDVAAFGTPLSLLQIPHDAIRDVQRKLREPGCILARYTQDCKMLGQLRARVATSDYVCAAESMLDVGYICKKCHMVYPGREACLGHQRTVCFPGGEVGAILKLEQIQYECCACCVKFCTLQEYKAHVELQLHRHKITVYRPPGVQPHPREPTATTTDTPTKPSVPVADDMVKTEPN